MGRRESHHFRFQISATLSTVSGYNIFLCYQFLLFYAQILLFIFRYICIHRALPLYWPSSYADSIESLFSSGINSSHSFVVLVCFVHHIQLRCCPYSIYYFQASRRNEYLFFNNGKNSNNAIMLIPFPNIYTYMHLRAVDFLLLQNTVNTLLIPLSFCLYFNFHSFVCQTQCKADFISKQILPHYIHSLLFPKSILILVIQL